MRFIHALSSLLVVGSLTTIKADSPPVVDLGYATYQGVFNSTANITNFLGIRYAAPPIGEHDFPPIIPVFRLVRFLYADLFFRKIKISSTSATSQGSRYPDR